MIKLRGYKYRIYPNKEQKDLLAKTFGCVRWVWNQNVAVFNSYNKESNPSPEFKTSTEYRQEIDWLKEVSAAAIQQKEKDFQEFKRQRFSNTRKKSIGNPSFKSKSNRQSFRLPNQKISLYGSKIRLEKIGWIKMVVDREIPCNSKILSATISKTPTDKYYASVLVEEIINYKPKTDRHVGIDVGIKKFAIQSDGIEISANKFFRESQSKLRIAQKHLSRKKIGSNRRNKQRLKVAKVHEKIANQRNYFIQEYTTKLVNEFDIIVIEDLNISGMVKNRRLSKSISDASWSSFFNTLRYKCEWYGKSLVSVDRFYASSKTCGSCGWKYKDLKLSERTWACQECGEIHDRDLNAAKNIERVGVNALYNQSQSECKANLLVVCGEAIKIK